MQNKFNSCPVNLNNGKEMWFANFIGGSMIEGIKQHN